MTRYRVALCDYPGCAKASARHVRIAHRTPPSVGPLFVPEMHAEPLPSVDLEACEEHADQLVVDVAGGKAWWPVDGLPREIPVETVMGRQWQLIDGGLAAPEPVADHQRNVPEV